MISDLNDPSNPISKKNFSFTKNPLWDNHKIKIKGGGKYGIDGGS
jgi:hypothetical protein